VGTFSVLIYVGHGFKVVLDILSADVSVDYCIFVVHT
jgi:hypothetical protein